jgi:hypothetical protein
LNSSSESIFDQDHFNVNKISGGNNSSQFNPIVCFPLTTPDNRIIGVMEIRFDSIISKENLELLDSFATFASISLENSELEQIIQFGSIGLKLMQWFSKEELKHYSVPKKILLPRKNHKTIFNIDFDSIQWDEIGSFKVLWAIFNYFDLFKTFKITNEKFFHFIYTISHKYDNVPYHNWKHAVDVTQFISYELIASGMENVFTKFEIFGLLVAAICHDANHNGFTNIFHAQAKLPFGILFQYQIILETHH